MVDHVRFGGGWYVDADEKNESGKRSFRNRLARFVVGRRAWVLALFALLAVPAAIVPFHVRIDNSSDIWFEKDSEAFLEYKRFTDAFGSDRFFLVACTRDDLFSPGALEDLAVLRDGLASVPGVEKAVTFMDVPVVRWTPVGPAVAPFLKAIPEDPARAEAVRAEALATPLFRKNLLAPDGRTAFALATVGFLTLEGKQRLVEETRTLLAARETEGWRFHVAGIPSVEVEIDRLTRRENATFIPLSLLVIVLTIAFLFRSVRITLWTAAVLLLGVATTISVFILLGRSFNIVTSLIPPLLMSIGIANAVHIMVHYREELESGHEGSDALVLSLGRMFRPCLFTSLTTAAGFLSLAVADIPPVRDAGIFGAGGILLAFALSFTVFPAGLSLIAPRRFAPPARKAEGGRNLLGRALSGADRAARRGALPVLLVSFALTGAAGFGIARIEPETRLIQFFKKDNPVRRDWDFMETLDVGVTTIELVFTGGPGAFHDPARLLALRRAQDRIEARAEVTRTLSAADMLDHALGLKADSVPRDLRARMWKRALEASTAGPLAGNGFLDAYLTPDGRRARVAVRIFVGGSRERLRLARSLRAEIGGAFGILGDVEIQGAAPLFARIDESIVESQKRMASVAAAAIFLMTAFLLGSLRLGALSMIPNVLPILLTLGLMGWAGIPLDVGTMIIAGVAVGIAVDDTIHYLTRFRRERARGAGVVEALTASHRTVGRAMVFTSAILFMGFGIIGLSAFRPVYTFGLLTGLTMALALAGDLLVLPALLFVTRGRAGSGQG